MRAASAHAASVRVPPLALFLLLAPAAPKAGGSDNRIAAEISPWHRDRRGRIVLYVVTIWSPSEFGTVAAAELLEKIASVEMAYVVPQEGCELPNVKTLYVA
jgi:hypothetical protein